MRPAYAYAMLLTLGLSLGVLLRVIQFPHNPPGFNQDEAASAYEAYSLAETGCDKWGNPLPAYFPAWGSGQNVLLAYLTVPAIKAFGLSVFSARLPSLVLGLLTLPLLWFALWPLGRWVALLGLGLLAVAPWHFMLARWGLESNMVPFFMLLGCTVLARALSTRQRRWIVFSLVPFALSLYAYGTTIVVLPLLLGATLGLGFEQVRARWGAWLLALGLFGLIASPFLIFFAENYVAHRNFAWTNSLFFSTPLLPLNRISQVGGDWGATLVHNFKFVAAGFDDGTAYNVLPGVPLLPPLVLPLTVVALAVGLRRARPGRALLWASPQAATLSVLALWALASLGLFFAFELNVNRFNHFFLPCLALAAWALPLVVRSLRPEVSRPMVWAGVLGWLALQGGVATQKYLGPYRKGPIKEQFHAGLAEAFQVVGGLSGVRQVRITDQIPLPYLYPMSYVYTLFYLRYPPARFRREVDVQVQDGVYRVHQFGRYVFEEDCLRPGQVYGYLSRRNEFADNARRHRQILFTNEGWEVGLMQPGPR